MLLPFIAVVLLGVLLYNYFLSPGKVPRWWAKNGIEEIEVLHVATPLDILLNRKTITERDAYAYKKMGSHMKFCGLKESPSPIVLIKDLDLAKKILIKDFDHFIDRRDFFPVANKETTFAKMMVFLKGDEWKGSRATLSPAFTTGKIRRMMEHFNSVGKTWTDMLKKESKGKPLNIDVISCASKFTIDVIGNSVFGINPGSITNPDSIFAKMAFRILQPDWFRAIVQNLSPRYPNLFKLLGIEAFDMVAMNFFEKIVAQGLESKMKAGASKNDFQQFLLEARKGEVKAEGSDDLSAFEKDAALKNEKKRPLTDQDIVAQSLLFFVAGFAGTSSFITFLTYVLAVHQDVQDKLRKEVSSIVNKDGTLDYDDLGKLVYMDMIVQETLRKYPPGLRLERVCLKEYYDPESGLRIPKDAVVAIPVGSIHADKTYYENADKFDPEHFSAENKAKRNNYAYLPFGAGPRNCIGMRFALVESKAAIAYLVHNFRIEPSEKTPVPIQMRILGIGNTPPENLEVRITPI